MNSWTEPTTPKPNPTPSAFPSWDDKGRDEVLAEWERMKGELSSLKEAELSFRKYVVTRAFPNPIEGMNTIALENGYQLKAQIKYNYNLLDNKIVEDGLDKIAKIGNQGAFIADRLVSWTPNFLLTEYRKLQEDAEAGSVEAKEILKLVNEFLEIKDAAPSLEIKEPKGKKK